MPFRADEDAPSGAPRTIGRYAIYGEIAAGGMATVHFGRLMGAVGFTRPVAIKRLHPQFAKDPEFVPIFIDEARIVSRIRHQNVVPTLDVVAAEDELFLVLGVRRRASRSGGYEGGARSARPRPVPPSPSRSSPTCLHGLHAAHEAKNETGAPLGIVHRDVSPQNILVGTDGAGARPRLRGRRRRLQVRALGRSTPRAAVQGKLAYMAPEQLAGGAVGRQADVYAAAVVLWELLAGRRLFQRANPQDIVFDKFSRVHAPRPTSLNEHAPKGVDAVVLRALAREAKERYPTAREMALALEACGKLATASEVGEWVERTAHDALDKRARQIRRLREPVARRGEGGHGPLDDVTMSALIASISPLAIPTPRRAHRAARAAPRAPLLAQEGDASLARVAPRARPRGKGVSAPATPHLRQASGRRIVPRDRRAPGLVVTARAVATRGDSAPVTAASRVGHASLEQIRRPAARLSARHGGRPGGRFFMGSDDDPPAERPAHHVTLSPYCIDIFEVTTDEYRACTERGDCRRASPTNEWNGVSASEHKAFDGLCNIRDATHGRHPINCVDWEMATQYCSSRGARLPTEAEWEFAARGSDGRRYPWGDEAPSPRLLNACGKECLDWGRRNHVDEVAMYQGGDGWPTTAPVGSFPEGRSKYGVQDLVGNVWEWVADYFGPYDPQPHDNPRGPTSGRERVIRGGAWNGAYADWMRPTFRYHDPPETKSYGIGFRCAADQGRYSRDELER